MMYMSKHCVLMGPTLGLYEMIMFKMKNFYWDRYKVHDDISDEEVDDPQSKVVTWLRWR